MRIVVVDFAAKIGGATSILKSFYQYLVDNSDQNEWIFLLSDHIIEETPNIKVVILTKEKQSRLRRLAFDLIYGRKLIRELNVDALFYLQNTLIHAVCVPQVMYMDQSLSFQTEKNFSFLKSSERKYAVYQHLIGRMNHTACKNAEYTVVQTEWLKKAIIEQCGVDAERVKKVAPNESSDCSKYHAAQIDQSTFFYPASGAIYKNHKCIYDALALLDEPCNVVLTIPEAEGIPERCQCVGTISQEEVYAQMEKSVLVFPSYIESFGLPLKEAREIGTIVLAADTLFAREILEGYENAYFFNTFCPNELAELMNKVISAEIRHVPQKPAVTEKKANAWESVVRIIRSTKK